MRGIALPGTVLAALTVSGLAVLGAAPTAEAAPPKCHGKEATIVGTAGDDDIKGTALRDVIVAGAGNDQVRAGDGDDIVCLGRGDDSVVTGDGDDWSSGGSGDDNLNNDFGGSSGADTGIGGDGDDYFFWGPDSGIIHAGDGSDSVAFFTAASADFRLDGGPGKDQVFFSLTGTHASAFVDAQAGSFTIDDVATPFTSWEKVTLDSEEEVPWTYDGTDRRDRVRLMPGSGRLVATLRGGDDQVQVDVVAGSDPTLPGIVHSLDGGDGSDTAIIEDFQLSGSATRQDCVSIETVLTQSSGACA